MYSILISSLSVGVFTISGILITNYFQKKRDERKFKQDLDVMKLNEAYSVISQNKKTIEEQLIKAHFLLSRIEYNISLTESVIISSSKISEREFDEKYQNNLEYIFELKGIIYTYFPSLILLINQIDGFYNNYWGNQRILNKIDSKNELEKFQSMQLLVIKIINESKDHFNIVRDKFVELGHGNT